MKPFHRLVRVIPILLALPSLGHATPLTLWIGTYAKGAEAGIYRADFDLTSGQLRRLTQAGKGENAGFLALSPQDGVLVSTASVAGSGGVTVWRRQADQSLLPMSSQATDGGVCHVSVMETGKTVLAANYGGGSVVSFALTGDQLSPRVSLIKHSGSGPNASRQKAPHAHCFTPLPGGQFAASADLGIDKTLVYKIDPASSALTSHSEASTPPGSGPRHLTAHPNGKTVYVLHELDHGVSVFDWSASTGLLSPRQVISGRPANLPPENLTSAEIRVRPDGKFVFMSTRDLSAARRDFLTVFKVLENGRLETAYHVPARVAQPRNFARARMANGW